MAEPPNNSSKSFKSKVNDSVSKNRALKRNKKSKSSSTLSIDKDSGIPKPVADRMARRIAILTGIPTTTGMAVFIGSYLAVSKGIAEIPPVVTLASSAACFLIGLLGLSYGMLSASWDQQPGTLLGLENVGPNIDRMRSAFKSIPVKDPSKK